MARANNCKHRAAFPALLETHHHKFPLAWLTKTYAIVCNGCANG
jgi:hypothetical protein